MDFKVYSNSEGATPRFCNVASATVLEEGDAVGITSGLLVKATATTAAVGIVAAASANGSVVTVPVYVDGSIIFQGTADANFTAATRGAEVDLVITAGVGLIDIGASTTDVLKIEASDNAGTVGSTKKVLFRLNKTI